MGIAFYPPSFRAAAVRPHHRHQPARAWSNSPTRSSKSTGHASTATPTTGPGSLATTGPTAGRSVSRNWSSTGSGPSATSSSTSPSARASTSPPPRPPRRSPPTCSRRCGRSTTTSTPSSTRSASRARVSGDVFVKVAYEPPYVDAAGLPHEGRIRILPLNPAFCFPEWHPHDRTRMIRFKLKYKFWGTADRRHPPGDDLRRVDDRGHDRGVHQRRVDRPAAQPAW